MHQQIAAVQPLQATIYRGTASGSETLLTTVNGTTTTYKDTDVTNGQTYYYEVSAVNSAGEGPKSSEVSATPQAGVTAPTAPQNLTATAGDGQVTLNWSAPADNGGSAITGYNIYRGTASGSEGGNPIATVNGTTTTYQDTGLTNGQTYYYKVSAVNSAGEGPKSSEVSATPQARIWPMFRYNAQHTGQSPYDTSGNQGTLKWKYETGDTVFSSPAIGKDGTVYVGSYDDNLYAINANGTLKWKYETGEPVESYSSPAIGKDGTVYVGSGDGYIYAIGNVPTSPPSKPQNLTATAGDGQVSLNWSAPASNGGSAITGYNIYRGTTSDGEGGNPIATVSGTTTTYKDTGLTNGQTYYYEVSAVNSAGEGPKSSEVSATPHVTVWAKAFGGLGYDVATSIQQTTDGGYIVAGYTNSSGAGGYDVWGLKLDSNGNIDGQGTFGGSGDDKAYSIQQTNDGGYIVAGETYSGAGGWDIWVLKLDGNGTVQWQKTYGGSSLDVATSIQQTTDGGYIVAGDTHSFGAGGWDIWVLKLAENGTIDGQGTFGGLKDDVATSIQQVGDGAFIVAGYTDSFSADHNNDIWVVKINKGNVEWQKTYGGSGDDKAYSIQQTNDGGYIVAGETRSFGAGGVWVLKLASDGKIEWQKTYGGDKAYSIQQTTDGGYIVAGDTYSSGTGSWDTWVLKLSSNGTIQWQKTYGGSSNDEYAYSIQQTSDGGYIVAGQTESFGAGERDMLILKLDKDGNIDDCPIVGTSDATVGNTTATGQNTSASIGSPEVTVTNTNATVTDPSDNVTVTNVCQ